MKNKVHEVKLIASPEEVFHFLKDINELRQIEIQREELVRRMSLDISTLNLN